MENKRRWRNIYVAGVASFFTDISSEMLVPVLPLFLQSVLGTPVAAIGLIEGVAEATASLIKLWAGALSDRVGRRKGLMLFGYSVSNVLRPLMGLAAAWPTILILRFLDRVGKGTRGAPRDALIADSSSPEQRGRAFGLHRAMDTAGAAVGPLLAYLILQHSQLRSVFYWSAVPGLLSVLVLLVFLHEVPKRGRSKAALLSLHGLSPGFRRYLAVVALFGFGNSADAFLVLRAHQVGMAVALVPLAYFLFNAVYALLAYPLGRLSDRVGRKHILAFGYIWFALVYLGFAAVGKAFWIWPLFALYGLFYAATEGMQKALAIDLADIGERGRASGALGLVLGSVALLASLIAGLLWQNIGPSATFLFGTLTGLAAGLWLLTIRTQPIS